jgi:hypothetical protein
MCKAINIESPVDKKLLEGKWDTKRWATEKRKELMKEVKQFSPSNNGRTRVLHRL